MRLVTCDRYPIFFLGTASGVIVLEVRFVFCARRDLVVVRSIHSYGNLLAGVLEDGAGGVAGIGAFKGDLEADIEEVLFKRDNMFIVGCAHDFCLIFARLSKDAGDFDGGSHGDDAGVRGEGARWLLRGSSVGASVGDRAGLLVGASVSRILG